MIELISTYSAEIVSTLVLLAPLGYAIKGRIVSDSNMLKTFQVAKQKIEENTSIKINMDAKINELTGSILKMENEVASTIEAVNESITNFMESELYEKMLAGLSQLDELKQTIENKDSTIEQLGREIKETNLRYQELLNAIKKG